MKQIIEQAAKGYLNNHPNSKMTYPEWDGADIYDAFVVGASFGNTVTKEEALNALSSVLGNWVHGGDADCIIAEFEERLDKQRSINE